MSWNGFEIGDFCQIEFEMFHPDKVSVPFWRNALFGGVDRNSFWVVFANGQKQEFPIQHTNRIRKPL